jgi:hypothetical protein
MTQDDDLKPDGTIFRFLFASSSYFVGECSGDAFHVIVAFPSWSKPGMPPRFDSQSSRFLLSLRTAPRDRSTIVIPTYEWVGEEISALLGAFYGKLIVNRGHLQAGSIHCIPDDTKTPKGDGLRPPFNNLPRKPDGPALNLDQAKRLIVRYFESQGEERIGWIMRAAEFYRLALENFHTRPEIALASFCSTLEALSPLREFTENELYDEQLLQMMSQIEAQPEGATIVRAIKQRLFQIKRKVAAFARHYVPNSFFEQRETDVAWGQIKDVEDLVSRLRRIYDLRSIVLHTGNRNGLWYLEQDHQFAEIGVGSPVLDDEKLKKTLVGAMTLTGLERVVSAILRAVINEWIRSPEETFATLDKKTSLSQSSESPVAGDQAGT